MTCGRPCHPSRPLARAGWPPATGWTLPAGAGTPAAFGRRGTGASPRTPGASVWPSQRPGSVRLRGRVGGLRPGVVPGLCLGLRGRGWPGDRLGSVRWCGRAGGLRPGRGAGASPRVLGAARGVAGRRLDTARWRGRVGGLRPGGVGASPRTPGGAWAWPVTGRVPSAGAGGSVVSGRMYRGVGVAGQRPGSAHWCGLSGGLRPAGYRGSASDSGGGCGRSPAGFRPLARVGRWSSAGGVGASPRVLGAARGVAGRRLDTARWRGRVGGLRPEGCRGFAPDPRGGRGRGRSPAGFRPLARAGRRSPAGCTGCGRGRRPAGFRPLVRVGRRPLAGGVPGLCPGGGAGCGRPPAGYRPLARPGRRPSAGDAEGPPRTPGWSGVGGSAAPAGSGSPGPCPGLRGAAGLRREVPGARPRAAARPPAGPAAFGRRGCWPAAPAGPGRQGAGARPRPALASGRRQGTVREHGTERDHE